MEEKIKILVVEPAKKPYVTEIGGSLEEMQEIVGGTVQATYAYPEDCAIVCNDEGKLIGLPANRALINSDGEVYDVICGTFFIAGLGEEDFCSLKEELIDKYSAAYATPEIIRRTENGEIKVEKRDDILTFSVWMLKETDENAMHRFMAFSYWKSTKREIKNKDFDEVYSGFCMGGIRELEVLEGIYAKFNVDKPADYYGRAISVGDVIVTSDQNRNKKAYFCDPIGFKEVPGFFS